MSKALSPYFAFQQKLYTLTEFLNAVAGMPVPQRGRLVGCLYQRWKRGDLDLGKADDRRTLFSHADHELKLS